MHHRTIPTAGGSIRRPVLTLTLALLAVTAALPHPAASQGLRPLGEYRQTPEQAGIVYDDVTFETADGVTLHGWFMPFQDHEGNENRRGGPIIILTSPHEVNMGDMLWHYFRFFRGTAWHVFVFDWRGFGSSGEWELDGRHVISQDFISDLHAAIDYVKTRREWDDEHIGIYSFNMGAAVSLAATATRDDVTCLAIRSPWTTQAEFIKNSRKVNPDRLLVPNESFNAANEPIEIAPQLEIPVWIAVGEVDPLTTPEMGRQIYEALGGKRQYWQADGAGHTGAEMPENVQISLFTAQIHSFYRRYLGTAGY